MLTRSPVASILAVAVISCTNQMDQSPDSTEQTNVAAQNIVAKQPPSQKTITARPALPAEIRGLTPGPGKAVMRPSALAPHLPQPTVSPATAEEPTSTTAAPLTGGTTCTIPFNDRFNLCTSP